MTRKENIERLQNLVQEKRQEITALQNQIGEEMVADFYESHGLKEGQHFFYQEKECIGVELAANSFFLKALPLTAKGEVSKKGLIIYSDKSVKPL